MKENDPTSSLKTAKPYPEYITMRDCLKLDLKDAIAQRDNLQDQRDFAMSEMERLKRERTEHGWTKKTLAGVTAERNQLRTALAQVAEDCTAWLHNERAETACEFIKAVRTTAHEQSQAPLAPSS